jgi:hypothetical protein
MNQALPQIQGNPIDHLVEELPLALPRNLPTRPAPDGRPRLALDPKLRDGARNAPVLLSTAPVDGNAQTELIQPMTSFRFVPHPVDSTSGICEISITLLNKSTHIAHQPFFCLTDLGLQLRPAPDWTMDEVVSIRRMRRFAPVARQSRLEPGSEVLCCTISLLFSSIDGGFVEYEIGNWHRLEQLPDLRISCVVGAGNYPSERLPITVRAEALREFMRELIDRGELPAAESAAAEPEVAEPAAADALQ